MRQKDLAALLGVAASTVANWERGASFPERHLGAVEALLGVDLTGDAVPDPVEEALRANVADPYVLDQAIKAYHAGREGEPARQRAG